MGIQEILQVHLLIVPVLSEIFFQSVTLFACGGRSSLTILLRYTPFCGEASKVNKNKLF